MGKFVLPIKSTYVPDWGLWHVLRELIQNAKDEEDQHGHPMKIEWKQADDGGVLTIHNSGADMTKSALLIGQSGKSGRTDLRGKFGEGLDLAMLAGARLSRDLVIKTQTEKWVPCIEHSTEYGEKVLVVKTSSRRNRADGVTATINISADEWAELRERFTFLTTFDHESYIAVPGMGKIILDPAYKGRVFAKGVYVDTLPKLTHGYDLDNCPLDRDRRMVDVWDLQYRLASMFEQAVALRPEMFSSRVYRMLSEDNEDTKSMRYHTSESLSAKMAEEFREEHGDNAVPVGSIAESQELEHLGRRGVVVPEALRDVLRQSVGDLSTIRGGLKNEIVKMVNWDELSFEEKAMLNQQAVLVDSVSSNSVPIKQRLNVAVFRDNEIEGLYNGESCKITISRAMLADPRKLLTVLIHEEAHAISAASDGSHEHVTAIENLWAKLYFSRTAS